MGSKYNEDFINNSIFKYNTCVFFSLASLIKTLFSQKMCSCQSGCLSQYPL